MSHPVQANLVSKHTAKRWRRSVALLYWLPASLVFAATPPMSEPQAARLLQQGTFGPTLSDIRQASQLDAADWIAAQMALPASYHRPLLTPVAGPDMLVPLSRLEVWWQQALSAPDQLRQRVAFALSEILVVSDQGAGLTDRVDAVTRYYDLLVEHAFGNYRDLLQAVTLSPVMGTYLSHRGNQKADVSQNIRPDENYARELMQLFTLGTCQLTMTAEPVIDQQGRCLPTYQQADIEALARVFTGWTSAGTRVFSKPTRDLVSPMIAFPAYHDSERKQLFGTVELAAGLTPQQDLTQALDAIFAQPSVAPFISKQLIQKLVTSNPTPAYVGRVSAVFADNGHGVRGDLAAVVRAILLDDEARTGFAGISRPFGKIREPLLKTSHSWRVTRSANASGHIYLRDLSDSHGQAPLQSPSVFNFYRPDFSPSQVLQQAGLVAPELQMLTDSNALAMQNHLFAQTVQSIAGEVTAPAQYQLLADFAPYGAVIQQQGVQALLDQYSLLAFAGQMPADLRQLLTELATGIRYRSAAQQAAYLWYFLLNSPQYAVQR